MNSARFKGRAIVAAFALTAAFGAFAQSTKTEIRIGNTVPYSGPASFYSMVGHATSAYFAKVNDEGGINGRKVQVISLDDALAPPKTVEQVRRMVEQDEVDLIVNQVGTATASSVRKYLNAKKVPQLFVQSGSNNFQSPKEFRYSTSGLMNYEFEARVYAKHILQNTPNARIGILFQNDDYGKDYVHGLKQGLGDKAKMLVSEITYQQSDPTVDSQVLELKAANVDTVILAAYSKQVSQALRKMTDLGWKPQVFISHVSAQVNPTLTNVGLNNVVGLMTASIIKDPSDPALHEDPDYKEYLAWMKKYYPSGDPMNASNASVYASSAAIAKVLKDAGDDLSRDNILAQLLKLKDFKAPMLLPGITMTMSPDNYNLFRKVQLMRFDGSHWVAVGAPTGE
ncbi:MAG: ABC transporter substrate-binding protein [Burkholderiaceae bacterium]